MCAVVVIFEPFVGESVMPNLVRFLDFQHFVGMRILEGKYGCFGELKLILKGYLCQAKFYLIGALSTIHELLFRLCMLNATKWSVEIFGINSMIHVWMITLGLWWVASMLYGQIESILETNYDLFQLWKNSTPA